MDKSLLKKALKDDSNPTPGYLYNDIAKITFDSTDACIALKDYLLKKIEKGSPAVKVKGLRVTKHTITKGHAQFQREMQREMSALRQCLHFRGDPDPITGDTKYRLVREAAQEVVDAIQATDRSNVNQSSALQGRIQGLGSENGYGAPAGGYGAPAGTGGYGGASGGYQGGGGYSGGGYGSSANSAAAAAYEASAPTSGGSGMRGFGNPNFRPPPPTATQNLAANALSVGQSVVGKVGNLASKFKRDSKSGPPQPSEGGYGGYGGYGNDSYGGGGYSGPGGSGGYGGSGYPGNQHSGGSDQYGGAGAGGYRPGQPGGGWGASAPGPTSAPAATSAWGAPPATGSSQYGYNKPKAEEPGEYEAKLVDDITAHAGVRPAPSKESLKEFVGHCEALQADIICGLLEEKLNASAWQSRLKTLYAIEALIKAKKPGVIEYFEENKSGIQEQMESVQSSVRDKAKKVLSKLGDDSSDEDPTPTPARKPKKQEADLLGSFEEPAAAEAAPASTSPAAPVAAPGGAAPASSSAFDFLNQATSNSPGTEGAAAAAAAPAPAQAGGELFGGMQVNVANAPGSQGAAPEGEANGGSAFAFMNAGSSGGGDAKKPPPEALPDLTTPTSEGGSPRRGSGAFDLSGLSLNNSGSQASQPQPQAQPSQLMQNPAAARPAPAGAAHPGHPGHPGMNPGHPQAFYGHAPPHYYGPPQGYAPHPQGNFPGYPGHAPYPMQHYPPPGYPVPYGARGMPPQGMRPPSSAPLPTPQQHDQAQAMKGSAGKPQESGSFDFINTEIRHAKPKF